MFSSKVLSIKINLRKELRLQNVPPAVIQLTKIFTVVMVSSGSSPYPQYPKI
jgi:hypothetical protein